MMREAAVTPDRDYFFWRVAGGMVVLVLALSILVLAQSGYQDEGTLPNESLTGSSLVRADGNPQTLAAPEREKARP
ncbi:hypothetical protein [Solidesulfovibrio fructosivorans]|nr:hypothetical protein [Solidesulfovibrio fructosivorans]